MHLIVWGIKTESISSTNCSTQLLLKIASNFSMDSENKSIPGSDEELSLPAAMPSGPRTVRVVVLVVGGAVCMSIA